MRRRAASSEGQMKRGNRTKMGLGGPKLGEEGHGIDGRKAEEQKGAREAGANEVRECDRLH